MAIEEAEKYYTHMYQFWNIFSKSMRNIFPWCVKFFLISLSYFKKALQTRAKCYFIIIIQDFNINDIEKQLGGGTGMDNQEASLSDWEKAYEESK